MKKRLLSLLLAVVILCTMLPAMSREVNASNALPYKKAILNIDLANIRAVGCQNGGQACACFSLAYCTTILDGSVHYYSEYNLGTSQADAICNWASGGFLNNYFPSSINEAYRTMYDQIVSGNPVVVKVLGSRSSHHYVAVVGVENVASYDTLTAENFLILDPAVSVFNIENMGAVGYNLKLESNVYQVVRNGTGKTVGLNSIEHTCNHNYNTLGLCSKCGYEHNWQATYDTSCAGIYKVSLSGGIYLRTDKPYSASTAKSELIKAGTEVKVLGSVLNAVGTEHHRWYKVSYNGIEGYTSEDNLTWVRENDKQPLATCDEVVGKDGSVYIRGWAFDPDTPSESVAIHVYIDDVLAGAYTANTSRPDVNNAYGCGDYHGFEFTVPCNTGTHSVVVFAINTTYGEDAKGMGPFSVTVSSHTHSYTSKVTTAATCTTAGVRTYTCSGCGASYTETIVATGHSYGSWQTTKAATCTVTGIQKRTCSKCGNAETKSISATGHAYGNWITTTAAGCTTTGTQKKTCSFCGDVQTQSISAIGHNYKEETIPATCTEKEKIRYTCHNCGDTYEKYTGEEYYNWSAIKPTGVPESLIESKVQYRYRTISYTTEYTSWSSWSAWQDSAVSKNDLTDVETQTLYPYYYYYCKRCGDSTRWYSYGGSCGACGTVLEGSSGTVVWLTTPWSEAVPYNPFGTNTGKYAIHIDGLAYWTWTDGSPKTQYRYRTRSLNSVTNYSSWSSWSDTAYSGSSSREVQTQTLYRYVGGQLGDHTWNNGIITTKPSCGEAGVKTFTCSVCNEQYTETIPAIGEHNYVGGGLLPLLLAEVRV